MTRTMYDSVTVANIPADAQMVAGYVNGTYTNYQQMRARFPHATVVGISVFAHFNAGQVLDVEQGDARPDQAPDWVLMRRAAGVDPTVYCSLDTWGAVRAAFLSRHLPEPHYWIAHYDGIADIPAGAIAKQYADKGPYDVSAVADHWPGIDPAQEVDMTPDQAQQLADLHKLLTPYAGWNYQGPDAGGGHDTVDVHQRLVDTDNGVKQLQAAVTGLTTTVAQLAAQIAKLTPHTAETAPAAGDGYPAPGA